MVRVRYSRTRETSADEESALLRRGGDDANTPRWVFGRRAAIAIGAACVVACGAVATMSYSVNGVGVGSSIATRFGGASRLGDAALDGDAELGKYSLKRRKQRMRARVRAATAPSSASLGAEEFDDENEVVELGKHRLPRRQRVARRRAARNRARGSTPDEEAPAD